MNKKYRLIFIVQGEGRGHMTQALALHNMLRNAGHEVGHVFIGTSGRRKIPSYFLEKISCPITSLKSPNFVTDVTNKSIQIGPTIFNNLLQSPVFLKELGKINTVAKEYKPDIIINFYDLLGGLYNFYYRPKASIVGIAHQFLAEHPDFKFAEGTVVDKVAYKALNYLTGFGADLLLALSFRPYSEQQKITIVPPLLRPEIKELQPEIGTYIHGYLLNDGYSREVVQWHQAHPEVELEFFWDKKDAAKETVVNATLRFHQINDQKFLEKMAGCKAFVSTAGFESICEAMYLGKPIMMVPVKGHFEQACNAIDACDSGAGISANRFDLSLLLDYIPRHTDIQVKFKSWADQAASMILQSFDHLKITPR